MKYCLLLAFIWAFYDVAGQKRQHYQPYEDSTCAKMLAEATVSFDSSNYTRARDYCEAALLICNANSTAFEALLKRTNNAIDKQKQDAIDSQKAAKEAAIKIQVSRDSLKTVNLLKQKIVEAFYFYNDRYALAFKQGRYGFVNMAGDTLIGYKFNEATPFGQKYGYAQVKADHVSGKAREYLLDTTKVLYPLARSIRQLTIDPSCEALITTLRNGADVKNIIENKQLKIVFVEPNYRDNSVLSRRLIGRLRLLPQLESVSFTNNGLTSFPRGFLELDNVVTLNLSGNQIAEIASFQVNGMCRLQKITKLDLSNNQLRTLPEDVKMLTTLRYVNLEGNRISTQEVAKIKSWLPKDCDILFKDYQKFPQSILTQVRQIGNNDNNKYISLQRVLRDTLEKYHSEVPEDEEINVALAVAKANVWWGEVLIKTRTARNADSLIALNTRLRSDILDLYELGIPDNTELNYRIAQACQNIADQYMLKKDFRRAEMAAAGGLEKDPLDNQLKISLGHALLGQNRLEEAKDAYISFIGSSRNPRRQIARLQMDFEKLFNENILPRTDEVKKMIEQIVAASK